MTEHQCPLCHGRGRILSDKLVKYQLIMSTYSEDQLGAKGLAMGDVVIKRESYCGESFTDSRHHNIRCH